MSRVVTETVTIPKGVDTGMTFKIPGKGGPATGPGASTGDLIIKVTVKPNPEFKREGSDVFTTAKISVADVRHLVNLGCTGM